MDSTDDTRTTRHKAHDDIEFLANSWHRLDVLEAIADGPQTRTALKDLTDVSRVTLSRILADLEERGWIVRNSGQFEATAHGAVVAREVSQLLDTLITTDELGEALEWLPIEEFDFDLVHLRDVSVITPDSTDLNAPTGDLVDLMREGSRIRNVTNAINREGMGPLRDAVVSGDLSLEYILTREVVDTVSNDPELRRVITDLCDAEAADLYQYLGDTPVTMVATYDEERVVVCGHGDGGVPPGTIQTTNQAIRSWAESYLDELRAESRQLEPAMLTP